MGLVEYDFDLSDTRLIVRLATIDLTNSLSPLRNLDTLLYSASRKIKFLINARQPSMLTHE
jgi:hypothetical protein